MKHIIRIDADWLRIPLLCIVWPLMMLEYVGTCLLPERWGGHPHKGHLLMREFYDLPIALFWAAWDGAFVPAEPR